jgi:fumarate reductase flavoprotein subunit
MSFLRQGSRVVGVVAEGPQGRCRLVARRGVVLASGDYSGGRELKARFAPPQAEIDAINPTNTGDGQLMCERLGCAIINGEIVSGPKLRFVAPPTTHWIFRLPPARLLTVPMAAALRLLPSALLRPLILSFVTTFLAPEPMMFREGAILVNRKGERFADESNSPQFAVAKQPNGDAFLVFDASFARKFSAWPHFVSTAPGVAYAYIADYKRTRPDLYREAATLDGLAEKLGIPASAFADTMERYNRADRIGPNGERPPIAEPPFSALGPVKAWTILTDGSVGVTVDHEVLHRDGSIIPGLYAAGSAGQGGLLLEGHGHHLGWGFTSGRRAGRRAAAQDAVAIDPAKLEVG